LNVEAIVKTYPIKERIISVNGFWLISIFKFF